MGLMTGSDDQPEIEGTLYFDVPLVGPVHAEVRADDGSRFLRGIDVHYAAEGTSLKDARKRFRTGLEATAREHIRMFGTASRLRYGPWKR